MLDAASKSFFAVLAGSATLKRLASRYGMRRGNSFARRFIAGETVAEALAAAKSLEQTGLSVTLDLLGESVSSLAEADQAARGYISLIEKMREAQVGKNISIKLTQLGLALDDAVAFDNVRRVLDAASAGDFFVRIDMENSPYTDATLATFESLWRLNYRNVGVVIQSYLRRSEKDLRRMNALGARVRLVKGAYREPATAAFQRKTEVDASYVALMRLLLSEGTYPAIATHDPAMIEATRTFAAQQKIAKTAFEFQMLYGIRRDLQTTLAADGHPMRVYVPFGTEWFPYFMRRLGERPANVAFVVRNVSKDR